jgi:hypothetical protein
MRNRHRKDGQNRYKAYRKLTRWTTLCEATEIGPDPQEWHENMMAGFSTKELKSFGGKSPRWVRIQNRKALPACDYMDPLVDLPKMPVMLEQDFKGLTTAQRKRAKNAMRAAWERTLAV